MNKDRVEKVTRTLRCDLTNDERLKFGGELADANQAHIEIDADKTEAMADFKVRLSTLEAEIVRLCRIVRDGYELRPIKCEMRFDVPDIGRVSIIRLDNEEIVTERAMSEDELREAMQLEEQR